MLKLNTILTNYSEWKTELDDRFGRRLCAFLDEDQMHQIGFKYSDGATMPEKLEWTEENVLKQLKEDVEFGWEKACNGRGISSSLMVDVIQKWCNVLENGLKYDPSYTDYGKEFIHSVDSLYGWHLTDKDVAEDGYVQKMWSQGMKAIKVKGEK